MASCCNNYFKFCFLFNFLNSWMISVCSCVLIVTKKTFSICQTRLGFFQIRILSESDSFRFGFFPIRIHKTDQNSIYADVRVFSSVTKNSSYSQTISGRWKVEKKSPGTMDIVLFTGQIG